MICYMIIVFARAFDIIACKTPDIYRWKILIYGYLIAIRFDDINFS